MVPEIPTGCPHCGTARALGQMTCGTCGYDFRTRQMGAGTAAGGPTEPPEGPRSASLASALLQQTAAMPLLDPDDGGPEPAAAPSPQEDGVPSPDPGPTSAPARSTGPVEPLDHVTRVGPSPAGSLPAAAPRAPASPSGSAGSREPTDPGAPSGATGPAGGDGEGAAPGPVNLLGAVDPIASFLRTAQGPAPGGFGSVPPDVTRVGPNVPVGPPARSESVPPASRPPTGRTSLPVELANLGFPDPQAPVPVGPGSPAQRPGEPGEPDPGARVTSWVAEIWIDPEWYADQEADEPCPPDPGRPELVPLTASTALIGRRSVSRNIHPTLECGSDTGVSRRHARLFTDGRRWWVEDLESANGTYIGSPGEPLPLDPLEPGKRFEITGGNQIYVGAWTRIALKPAGEG